jgi:phosphotriesterase-related protein
MKNFRFYLSLLFLVLLFNQCNRELKVITVTGEIPANSMGKTLSHEHMLVDFIGADSTGYNRWNRDTVVKKVLPYLMKVKAAGIKTIVDCTPAYLGRDPKLLKVLSEKSGINILSNTGYYGAFNNKYLPHYAFTETAEQLADRWIDEAIHGIEDTGIKPGFIKIAVEANVSLSAIHKKLVQAAIITNKRTGLVIASHTVGSKPAFEEMALISESGISLQSFIWVHSPTADVKDQIKAAEQGAWISIDNVNPDSANLAFITDRLKAIKSAGYLNHVLLSHDAGWYDPSKAGGGNIRGYTALTDSLFPILLKNGFTNEELDLLLVTNPAHAFGIK